MNGEARSIHATAVLVGARALLFQGPPGSGKSRLASALIEAAQAGVLRFARLVADDRVLVESVHGGLLARPAPALAGLIEVRGLGIRRVAHEPLAVVGAVVELSAVDGARLPQAKSTEAMIEGVRLPRLAVAAGIDPFPIVRAYLLTEAAPGR